MSARKRPQVSIIIRTRNEERWIGACLRGVHRQTFRDYEVVLVDNRSSDRTVAKARAEGVDVVIEVDEFLPGRALNQGIRASNGSIIVCLSGHCIPVNETWLDNLVKGLADPGVAGIYGRQEPLSFSSDIDKRDLLITFGLDRRVQVKDSFFHNANSAMRRETWQLFPFDETVTNIEDRLWAKQVLAAGLTIVYEPEARVYHHHGIHHGQDAERARSVVQVLEAIEGPAADPAARLSEMHVVVVIPCKGPIRSLGGVLLLERAILDARASPSVGRVYVAADTVEACELAERLGATAIRRPAWLSEEYVEVLEVIRFAVERIAEEGRVPDLVAVMEQTYPFRPSGLLERMIAKTVAGGFDSVVAARSERRRMWFKSDDETKGIADSAEFKPRAFREAVAYVSLFGLACVFHGSSLAAGLDAFGRKQGVIEVDDPFSAIEVRERDDQPMLAAMLQSWDGHRGE